MRRAVVVIVAVVGALTAPATAAAHATLQSSEPATQVRVDAAPTEIRLRFNAPVTVTSGAIQVLGPDGALVSGTAKTEDGGHVVVSSRLFQ